MRKPADDATTRFSERVDDYVRYRPGYPGAVVECLRDEFGLRAGQVIADVGSGTGILSELLLKNGNVVIGVEPNGPMRAAAERMLAGNPRFRSVEGTAEATGLGDASVDWVTAGQAFHWFDVERARAEFRRVLRAGGQVALLWNNRLEHTAFLAEYEGLLQKLGTDYLRIKHQGVESDGSIERFYGAGGFERREFENRQVLDFDGLRGRTMSASYVPKAGQAGHAEMIAGLEALFARYAEGERVVLEYQTRMYVGRVS